MGSKVVGNEFLLKNTERKEQVVKTERSEVVENDDSNITVPPTISALTNMDPSSFRTVFQSSKIKSFLYKVEPNIAKVNGPSLNLMSATAALFLKRLVEEAVKQEQDVTSNHKYIKTRKEDYQCNDHPRNEKQGASLDSGVDYFLITSNQLKRVVSANSPSSLVFLEETYQTFLDKDNSILPSKLHEYVPRNVVNKTRRGRKRPTTEACNSTSTKLVYLDHSEEGNKGDIGKKDKQLSRKTKRKASSSLLLMPKTNPLDKAIANAVNGEEKLVQGKIIEDDDYYD